MWCCPLTNIFCFRVVLLLDSFMCFSCNVIIEQSFVWRYSRATVTTFGGMQARHLPLMFLPLLVPTMKMFRSKSIVTSAVAAGDDLLQAEPWAGEHLPADALHRVHCPRGRQAPAQGRPPPGRLPQRVEVHRESPHRSCW